MKMTALLSRIMEGAMNNRSMTIDQLALAKEALALNQDGSEILNVEHADRVELANEYIETCGKDAFTALLENSGDLAGAIYSAANHMVSEKALQSASEMMDQMIARAGEIKNPPGFRISKLHLHTSSSSMDFFPPRAVVGNCEQYRNIEGSGNCDVYRERAKVADDSLDYVIEAWLEPVS